MKVTIADQDAWDSFWSLSLTPPFAPSYALVWIGRRLWLCYPGEEGDLWGVRPPDEDDEGEDGRYVTPIECHTVIAPHSFPVTVVWHDGDES